MKTQAQLWCRSKRGENRESWFYRYYKSVLWIRIHFFRIHNFFRILFRIRILILLFWPEICYNGASHCFHMCSGICTPKRKVCQLKNVRYVFSLLGVRCAIFHKSFILKQCLDPNPNPNPNSHFFRIRNQPTIIRILSDSHSNPQHYYK
jgi:hypothetical protein